MRRAAIAAVLTIAPSSAWAHVRITSPTPRSSDQLKQRHCGATGSARANVQTYAPGAPMHLVWDEYVQHPGWFRISFQQNGDTFEIPRKSTGPSSKGASNYPTENLTGKTDQGDGSQNTGSFIIADRILDGTLSYDFMLPNVTCDNCTLQLIQMMTDKPPYAEDTTSDDIYYACVDLVLTANAPAPDAGGTGTGTGTPGPDAGISGSDAGASGGGVSGGCSASGSSSGALALVALGLLGRRRYRRAPSAKLRA